MMPPEASLGDMDRESVIKALREGWRQAEHFQTQAERFEAEVGRQRRRIAELEEQLRTLHRSATPFSKNRPKPNPKAPGRKAGQGRFERRAEPVVEPQDEVRTIEAPLASTTCPNCGGSLDLRTETATTTDLPSAPRRVVTEFKIQTGHCSRCHADFRGTHPELPPDQHGATAHRVGAHCKAAAISLHYGLGVPQRKVPLILRMMTGIEFSQSALNQSAAQLCKPNGPAARRYEGLRRELRAAPVVNTDDTGWKIGGKAAYLMGFFSQTLAVYQIRPRHTNREVREMLGIDFGGLLGTDRGPSYDAEELSDIAMQKCLSHLLKNISQAAEKKTGVALIFLEKLKALLRAAIKLWQQFKSGEIGANAFKRRGRELSVQLTEHLHPRKFRDADAQRILDGIGMRHDNGQVLLFLERPEIEPTNNRAERGLRPAVISRKVSQCSKNQKGATMFAIFKSLTETMKLRTESLITGIAELFNEQHPAANRG